MIRCVDDIREQVRRETGLSLTDAQIENMLAGQPCTVSDTRQKLIDKRLNLSRYLRLSLLGIVIAIRVLYWYTCATKSNEDMKKIQE